MDVGPALLARACLLLCDAASSCQSCFNFSYNPFNDLLPAFCLVLLPMYTPQTPQDVLHSRFRVEVPVKTLSSTLYVRISAHVYNTLDDYRVLAAAVQELQQQQQQH